jgi:DNA invertase Pin-like site-specific DNA recombinase
VQIKKYIAMYIRLSKEDANIDGEKKSESNSVSAQRKLLSGFVETQDEFKYRELVEYVDDGYSGANFERPSFKRMMDDAREGRIGVIIIKDFSRLGRNHLEVGNYLEKIFPLLKIRIISVNDGFDSENCAGMTGGMSVVLKNMINAMYIRDLSGKVQSAMLTHAKKGEYLSARPKYGYRKDPNDKRHLIVDPEAADIVKLIFTMAAEGSSRRQIARYLNENKVPTCSEYMVEKGYWKSGMSQKEKVLWNDSTIKHMLKDEIYLGNIVWNKVNRSKIGGEKPVLRDREEWVVVKGTHEPIVSEELFQKVSELSVKKAPKVRAPQVSGRVPIECAYCGRRLDTSSTGKTYKCSKASVTGIPGCRKVKIGIETLEETVLSITRDYVQSLSEKLECRKKEWRESAFQSERLTALNAERKRLSSRKMKIYSDYRSGRLTKEGYMKEYRDISDRIEEIDRHTAEMERESEITREKLESSGEKQAELNDVAALNAFDRKALSKVIERINVYENDKIEILWKMDDVFFDEKN